MESKSITSRMSTGLKVAERVLKRAGKVAVAISAIATLFVMLWPTKHDEAHSPSVAIERPTHPKTAVQLDKGKTITGHSKNGATPHGRNNAGRIRPEEHQDVPKSNNSNRIHDDIPRPPPSKGLMPILQLDKSIRNAHGSISWLTDGNERTFVTFRQVHIGKNIFVNFNNKRFVRVNSISYTHPIGHDTRHLLGAIEIAVGDTRIDKWKAPVTVQLPEYIDSKEIDMGGVIGNTIAIRLLRHGGARDFAVGHFQFSVSATPEPPI